MRFAINLPNFGAFADAQLLADLAAEAESNGWDGLFIWDHMRPGSLPVGDPWIALTAIALATSRIRMGPMVVPLPRRRPEEVARQAVTLDYLSHGRLILGVGLGDDLWREFSAFGQELDPLMRARMLDEALEVILGLWRGEPFSFEGKSFAIHNAQFLPRPLQQPSIPIWVAGGWPAKPPFRRGARWQGIAPVYRDGQMTPEVCRDIVQFTLAHRQTPDPLEVAVTAWQRDLDDDEERRKVTAFAAAGATWYQVSFGAAASADDVRAAIRRRPPRS